MFSKFTNSPTIRKCISTSINRYNSEAVSITDKDGYRNLGGHDVEAKPPGWDEAKPFEAIPGPKPIPVLGNMWRFFPYIGEFHNVPILQFYKRLHEIYGNVVVLKGMGRKPSVLLFDTNDMEMLLRNAGTYPIRRSMECITYYRTKMRDDVFQGVGGILTVQGEEWLKYRSLVNPILMQPRVTQKYIGVMDLVTNDLIRNMDHFSKQNENQEMPEDFISHLYNWGLELIAVVAFNKRLGCLDLDLPKGSETQRFIKNVVLTMELMYYLEVRPPVWKLISTPRWKKFVDATDDVVKTSMKYIEECLAEVGNENVPEHELGVLQRLVKIDKKFAIAMAVDMLTAGGVDTTGKTLGAAIYFLAKNPEKQECLRQEVLKNLREKSSPVTKEVLDNSPYLKAVIKETTRMAPITIGNFRTSVKDLVLGGYRIPKDNEVMTLHLIASHYQFKESEKFIPERYLRTTEDEYSFKNASAFASLPFGHGTRSCVGKRLANLELEVALSKIIRHFELSWPHEDMVFASKLLYGIASPLKVKVRQLER